MTIYKRTMRRPNHLTRQASAFPDREIAAKADGRFAKADKQRARIKSDPKKAVMRARARVRDFNR